MLQFVDEGNEPRSGDAFQHMVPVHPAPLPVGEEVHGMRGQDLLDPGQIGGVLDVEAEVGAETILEEP